MAILIDHHTRVVVQGMTGREGRLRSGLMMQAGTVISAGVTPGRRGETLRGVPIYNTVREAVAAHPEINTSFIQTLTEADLVAIAGEAGSHCLANTVRDVANNFGDDGAIRRLVLLEDATSPVPGFEHLQAGFIREMRDRGMQVATTRDFLA